MTAKFLMAAATFGTAALMGLSVVNAGTLSYQAINNAADSGISTSNTYTTAVGFSGSGSVNGVNFDNLTIPDIFLAPTVGTAPGLSVVAANGGIQFASGGNNPASGELGTLLNGMAYDNGASKPDAKVTFTLTGLTAGTTYDYRIYMRQWGGGNRIQTFDFTGDGTTSSVTLNEDDATTAGMGSSTQAYYINYNFTYDGVSAPGVVVTPADTNGGFHAYAQSNQVVVPEPASLSLLGLAGLGLLGRRSRKA